MQPSKTTVIGLFNAPFQYQIPIFQRGYVWTLEKQVVPLWLDIQSQADALLERQHMVPAAGLALKPLPKHFLGSIVMTPVPNAFGRVPMYEVIDGQQRSTTLHLLLLALRHAAQDSGQMHLAQMLAPLVRNPGPYLVDANDHHKVWPTQAGRQEMQVINTAASVTQVCQAYPARDGRSRIERPLMVQTFLYLYHACLAYMHGVDLSDPVPRVDGADPDRSHSDALVASIRSSNDVAPIAPADAVDALRVEILYMALADQVQLMTLSLDESDDPQVIFETLNARGEPLLASDLVRNFLFLEAARQGRPVDALYASHWRDFDQVTTSGHTITANRYWRDKEKQGRLLHPRIDLFFYHYTVLRSQESTLVSHVFQAFKGWWVQGPRVLEDELQRIQTSSRHFAELISPQGTGYLAEFARLLKALDVGTVTPVVLALRERLAGDSPELKQALGDLASYLVRRSVCGLTTKGYNRFFLRVLQAVCTDDKPHEALRQVLLAATAASEFWPHDQQFGDQWLTRPAYTELKPGKVCALLRALEYAARGGKQGSQHVPEPAALTVEHVMPQSWDKVAAYQLADMSDVARQTRQTALHTFGNLTLLTGALNSSMSNGPFADSVDVQGRQVLGKRSLLGQSALLLNTAWFHRSDIQQWDEAAMRTRGQALRRAALLLWSRPAQIPEADAVFDVLAGRNMQKMLAVDACLVSG